MIFPSTRYELSSLRQDMRFKTMTRTGFIKNKYVINEQLFMSRVEWFVEYNFYHHQFDVFIIQSSSSNR